MHLMASIIRRLGSLLAAFSLLCLFQSASAIAREDTGAVYTMSNDPTGNKVLVFDRAADGLLTFGGAFSTGGLGTGGSQSADSGLGNAGALALSENNSLLFVVNAGSNDVSVFAVKKKGLELLDRESSGGKVPVSVTVNQNLVYVLNAGGNVDASDKITGFVVNGEGKLSQLSDLTRPLSAAVTFPSQIKFTPDGRVLVVTEKATNVIDTYTVGKSRRATGPIVTPSAAPTPFGFYLSNRNQLFVSDTRHDAPGAGALSSYLVSGDGSLRVISSAVSSNQTLACWTVVSNDGRFAYSSNSGSSTVSLFPINKRDGSVTIAKTFQSLFTPTDLSFSLDGRFLYVLNTDLTPQGTPGIGVFRMNELDGSLIPLPGVSGLPGTIDGLVAR